MAEATGKERPILFAAPMVRAILSGTKTQTRRVVRTQPGPSCTIEEGMPGEAPFVYSRLHGDGPGHEVHERRSPYPCPYGQPGDRLWVRETWQAVRGDDRARHIMTHPRPNAGWIEYAATPRDDEPAYKWRPSIHMPRWASRILLEITDVRVERLQEISEDDAGAEGVLGWDYKRGVARWDQPRSTNRDEYQLLWEQINGACSWDANPWVWVVQFRRVEPC